MTDAQLNRLLGEMSLDEKIYQLVQLPPTYYHKASQIPGTEVNEPIPKEMAPQMGSILYITDAGAIKEIQNSVVMQQPHGIPMLFMMDVIHGFKTIFPIPLSQAGSFHMDLIAQCAEAAAKEAAASGIHVVFSPMVDLVRDARWGRVMESAGEDPMLSSEVGKAMIQGYQGGRNAGYSANHHLSACFKHFAAYGAAEGGRDYNNAELSEYTLRSFYLPAYEAAVRAGCDMAMTSFNTWNGIPSSGNPWLLTQILREEWGFDGVVISDWNAIGELVEHGVCRDLKEAACMAFRAGVDIDMCSFAYALYLKLLIEEDRISEDDLDRSVLRVLKLKDKHGLFDHPCKCQDAKSASSIHLCETHRNLARRAVCESLVLLKNSGDTPLLPLRKGQHVTLAGPYVYSKEMLSSWAPSGNTADVISVFQAAEEVKQDYVFSYASGCVLNTREDYLPQSLEDSIRAIREGRPPVLSLDGENSEQLLAEAVRASRDADAVVVLIGEHPSMSGEGASRGDITIPRPQMRLLKEIQKVNQNIVSVVFAGRPLDLREVCRYSKAVLYAWLPGTEGGHGIMDVLTGAHNPSGRLAMSLPYSVGQIPIHYTAYRTGRPKSKDVSKSFYTSAYNDIPNSPLFPFGYGLSYTDFAYSQVELSAAVMTPGEKIEASVCLRNIGHLEGMETVQMYLSCPAGNAARPMRMLKGFRKVLLQAGEMRRITFEISEDMLKFYDENMNYGSAAGTVCVYIGSDSETLNGAGFLFQK